MDTMSDRDSSSMAGAFLGTLSITAIYSKILEIVGPRLMSAFGLDINFLVTLAVLCFAIYTGFDNIEDIFKTLVHRYYSCTVKVRSQDILFTSLMDFFEEEGAFSFSRDESRQTQTDEGTTKSNEKSRVQKKKRAGSKQKSVRPGGREFLFSSLFPHTTRHIEASIDGGNGDYDSFFEYPVSDSESSDIEEEENPTVRNKSKLKFAPQADFEDFFYYKPTGHTIYVLRQEIKNAQPNFWDSRPKEVISLTILGLDPTPLRMLLGEVVERQNNKDHGRTVVYKARHGTDHGTSGAEWRRCFSKPLRSLGTVILDDKQKEEICDDLGEFLLPATSRWYANRGLPYRRGYLLYGPPGTGKTSLSMALAGKFRLPVYSLALSASWMTDDTLSNLFSSLPKNCIVLMEDIDACGITRPQDNASKGDEAGTGKTSDNKTTNSPLERKAGILVSFSGLLNAIDGVASKEGRALIMTTNHRERLDEALIRPGRVDLQIKFAHADKKIIHGLFQAIYEVDEFDRQVLKFPEDFPDDEEIADLANAFAEKVPESIFTPAEVQGFLLKYKKHPREAAAEVAAWVEKALLEKQEKVKEQKLKEEKERKEREKEERREKRKREKEEKEKREKREKEKEEKRAKGLSDDTDTEDEGQEEKKEESKNADNEMKKLTNGDNANGTVNSTIIKTVNEISCAEVKTNGSV